MNNERRPAFILDVVPEYDDGECSLLALQESWADFARALRVGTNVRVLPGRIRFFGGAREVSAILDVYQRQFDAGDKSALIRALKWACEQNVILPYWAADGILAALDRLEKNPGETLHSVFGIERVYPESLGRARKARRDQKTKLRLYGRTAMLMASSGLGKVAAIERAIAEERLPIRFRTAFKWFNEMDRQQQLYLRAWRGCRLHKSR